MIITRDRSQIENGVVQLRFADADDNVRDISAQDLAEVLEGLLEFSRELAKSGEFGDGPAPEIRIRVPKQGSFVLEALVWLAENPLTGAGATGAAIAGGAMAKELGTAAGKAITNAIGVGLRRLRSEKPERAEMLQNGEVLLTWPDQTTTQITTATWSKLNEMKRPTRTALRKLMSPLGKDAEKLEVRSASVSEPTPEILSEPAAATARAGDYLAASTEPVEAFERERVFETEAVLRSIDFDSPDKWRVETTKEGTRQARIDDREFLLRVDRGEAIHKGDIFWLKILEVVSKEPGKNTSKDWTVLEVRRTKRGERDADN
ncbi:hypothetical protein [Microbacterium sp. AG238]|uniref:hypothetical protein n=1 Tax=Microbacterium sp. AG238 TaxID=2183994 RepID=UPI000E73DC83|nr:hypothetical protein [Microbacterium sp. AG238]RKE60427.1 hypothetical protein DEU36_2868 [Microbacterium sp. AG238]